MKKTPDISFQALAAHEEHIGLSSTPITDSLKSQRTNLQSSTTRINRNGEWEYCPQNYNRMHSS